MQHYLCFVTDEQISLDAQTLRGIAHPLRLRMLNLLREEGPSTATRLAERTGQSSGATSYHLRQLAAYGFVVPASEQGEGRERWWRAAHRGNTLEAENVRAAPEAAEAYLRTVATEYAERMSRWVAEATITLPSEWDHSATLSNWRLRLTAAEAARLLTDLTAVIDAYRNFDGTAGDAPDGAERVDLQLQLMPFPRSPQ